MTKKDIDDIISIICPNDEDFEKTCISPAYLKKELEVLALEQEPCEDAVSRQAVINAIANTCFWLSNDNWKELTKCINSISPVTPQQTKKLAEYLCEEPKTWSLDDAREDFTSDVYDTLDFLPTNNEANRIIDSFDRVTSSIKQEPVTCPSAGIDCGDCPASEQEPCEDAVSRQAVLDAVYNLCGEGALENNPWRDNPHIDAIVDAILDLSSVTPQIKTGHWILSGGYWRCSECKEKALLKLDKVGVGCREYIPIKSNYCPNCGKKMEVEE